MEKAERIAEGIYLYCIIGTDEAINFGDIGIGGRGDAVTTIGYEAISCVISKTPVIKYTLNRENLLAHQRVIERVMKDWTVLPVRFSTIADSIEDIRGVLRKRYEEFKNLLRDMDNKIELGIKALWKDMDRVFQEMLQEDEEIKRLRDRIAAMPPAKTYGDKINLGRMVQAGLKRKKEAEADKMMNSLKTISADTRVNQVYGDNMVLNAAFLVGGDR
ncbi:MAG: GvpL/GvpF family gas vesicle protein [Deltaproteobacteria bacterium]|nr:GvpL/GvpF family gas vesicle protein [Deltaproteobacteria bacterium]